MKENKMRLLAAGLAATMIVSNAAPFQAFAEEPAQAAVHITVEMDIPADTAPEPAPVKIAPEPAPVQIAPEPVQIAPEPAPVQIGPEPAPEPAPAAEETTEESEPEQAPAAEENADENADGSADGSAETEKYVPANVVTDGVGTSDDMPDENAEPGEVEEFLNKAVRGFTDCSLDMLDDTVPGGKFIKEGIKLIMGAIAGDEDPTEAALKNLSQQEDTHFNQLSNQIESLNDDVEKYARLLDNKVVNQVSGTTLGTLFREMNKNLIDLSDSVVAIKNSKDYTPEQKLVLIADLNNSQYLKDLRQATYTIDRYTINTGKDVFDLDLFETLLSINSEDRMFKKEAFDSAEKAISTLMAQYFYANSLLLECQNAGNALNFTKDQIAALGDEKRFTEAYKRCKRPEQMNFLKSKQGQTIQRISNGLKGLSRFEDSQYSGNSFIMDDPANPVVLDISTQLQDDVNSADFKKMYEGQYLNKKEMTEFTDYIRKAGAGKKSVYDFLKDNYQYLDLNKYTGVANSDEYNQHRYIVVDPTVTTTAVRNPNKDYEVGRMLSNGYHCYERYLVYDVTETIKVIDIYDPECKVQDLIVKKYERNNEPGKPDQNIRKYRHCYVTIGGHSASDEDKLVKDVQGKLVTHGAIADAVDTTKNLAKDVYENIPDPFGIKDDLIKNVSGSQVLPF